MTWQRTWLGFAAVQIMACGGAPAPAPVAPPVIATPATEALPPPPDKPVMTPPFNCPPGDFGFDQLFVRHWPHCPIFPPMQKLAAICPSGRPCMQPCRSISLDVDVVGTAPNTWTTTYEYDAWDRYVGSTWTDGKRRRSHEVPACVRQPNGCSDEASYEEGRLVETRDGDSVSRYQWDSQGRLVAIVHSERSIRLDYDGRGRLVKVDDTELSYDDRDRLVGASGMGPRFTYDAEGRVASVEDMMAHVRLELSYDGKGRLIREIKRPMMNLDFIMTVTHYFYECRQHTSSAQEY